MTFNELYMQFAKLLAERSHHPETKVGAVIVSQDNSQIHSLGYNANYAGGPNQPDSLAPGASGLIHAEANALLKYSGPRDRTSKLYVTHSPCLMCAKHIINSKAVGEVYYNEEYRLLDGLKILEERGIKCRKLK